MYDYGHGGNAVFEPENGNILDLSANINPLSYPDNVPFAIIAQIPNLVRYPDSMSTELRNEIAQWERVPSDWLFCGNGASDIIFRLPVCIKPKTALLPAPTFSDYGRALSSFGVKITHSFLDKDSFEIGAGIVNEIEQCGADIVFICNPNNPTGLLTKRDEMEKVISFCYKRGIFIVVDECFLDFTENAEDYTVKPFLKKYNNLLILKAFTKVFALPGIRLGYAICSNNGVIERLFYSGADWAVSSLAQAAGIAAVKGALDGTYFKDTVSYVAKERQLIMRSLGKMGYITFNSKANYLFFRNPYDFNLFEMLNSLDIRIRNCGNYEGLSDDYYRVAVSTSGNNRKFLEAMTNIGKNPTYSNQLSNL